MPIKNSNRKGAQLGALFYALKRKPVLLGSEPVDGSSRKIAQDQSP